MWRPKIPPNHTLCDDATARRFGYWQARDAAGYEYVVGAWTKTDGDIVKTSTLSVTGRQEIVTRIKGVVVGKEVKHHGEEPAFAERQWLTPVGLPPDLTDKDALKAHRAARLLSAGIRTGNWNSDVRCLWLHGAPGRGKTQLAEWVAADVNGAGLPVAWLDCGRLPDQIRAGYGSDLEAAADWRRREAEACAQALLVLDDLGTQGNGEDLNRALYLIADARWRAGLATIVTSNAKPDDMLPGTQTKGGLDPRVVSRLAPYVVAVGGKDWRSPK